MNTAIAPLSATYGMRFACGAWMLYAEVVTIVPDPRATSCGSTALTVRTTLISTSWTASSQTASVASSRVVCPLSPVVTAMPARSPSARGGLRDHPFRLFGTLADVAHDRDDLDRVLRHDGVGRAPRLAPRRARRPRPGRRRPRATRAASNPMPAVPPTTRYPWSRTPRSMPILPRTPVDGERLCRLRPDLVVHGVFERWRGP